MLFSRAVKRNPEEVPAAPPSASAAQRKSKPAPSAPSNDATPVGSLSGPATAPSYIDLKVKLHGQLLDMMNLAAIEAMPPLEFRNSVGEMLRELLKSEAVPLNLAEHSQIVSDVLDELLGLGPIEPLLKDASVTDIIVNTHKQVFVERAGLLELTPVRFKDDKHLLRIIDKIVSAVGRRVDESQPMVDARLADGSRVNAVIPPLAVDGPLLSIRKFAKIPINLAKLVEIGSLPAEFAELLKGIVKSRRNVLISGGTGSGKTTMLNAMSAFIDNRERIVTIEDAAELQLQQTHVARLETRPANIEGTGAISQRELVRNALRMRPDRIIVGEVRGSEAIDMLQAMNTGHEGSMTTIHANSCRESLSRLEQMIGMARMELSPKAMREQIASAINVVIQLQRMSDGRRRLISLQEITGMEGEVVTMQEIFRFNRLSTDAEGNIHGEYRATGIRPKFMNEFETRGIRIPPDIFEPTRIMG